MLEIKLFHNCSEDVDYNFNDFPIRARQASLSDYLNRRTVNHWHDDLEFTIVLTGQLMYSINGANYVIKEGQALFINSQQMHYGCSSDGSNCQFICLLIHPSLLSHLDRIKNEYMMPLCHDQQHSFFIFDPSISWQKKFIDRLHQTYDLCTLTPTGFELQVMSLLYSMCFDLCENIRHTEEIQFDKNIETLRQMIGYIQQNYKSKIKLNDIAAAGNVCRSNCCKIFQSILNKSPITYLTDYRLEKSLKLLQDHHYSITEIAYECGFSSSSYFTETFHREMGCTPSKYRKKYI